MTRDEALARFTVLTGGDLGSADDFLKLDPDEQTQAIWNYAHASWAKDPDVAGEIVTILGVVATVAVDLSGVAGAFSAIRAL